MTFVTLTWPLTKLRFLITGLSLDYYDGRKEPVSWLISFAFLMVCQCVLGICLCVLSVCVCAYCVSFL